MFLELKNEQDTINLAKKVAPHLKIGDVIALYGELGAGKTFFTQQLCKFLDVEEYVSSPSYILMNEYIGKMPIFHLDFYRLGSEEEVLELGIYDFYDKGLTIIEWPQLAEFLLPQNTLRMFFTYDGDSRSVEIKSQSNIIDFIK